MIADVKRTPPPKPRLTRDGYTQRGGSPTQYMVRLKPDSPWRRVYGLHFSNAGSLFVKVRGEPVFLDWGEIDLILSRKEAP